jgi:hypothetical protein
MKSPSRRRPSGGIEEALVDIKAAGSTPRTISKKEFGVEE